MDNHQSSFTKNRSLGSFSAESPEAILLNQRVTLIILFRLQKNTVSSRGFLNVPAHDQEY
jgi:hypothetical protein